MICFILEVYGGDDMFVIPEPTPVTVTGIGGSTYDFIDMSKLGNDPRQPRTVLIWTQHHR